MQSLWLRYASAGAAVAITVALFPGCMTIGRVVGFGGQADRIRLTGRIDGRIDVEGSPEGTLVVLVAREPDEEGAQLIGVDTFVRLRPGSFRFAVDPGRYRLGAYEDRNQNGLLDLDERVSRSRDNPVLELESGGRVTQDIVLKTGTNIAAYATEPIDIFELVERTHKEQQIFSLWSWSVQGAICESLAARGFGPDAGARGLWEIMDFVTEGKAGIYFMEPYDPDRIPVLFVHGISGYPRQFSELIAGIDRERFQPWFYFYPSGFTLDGLSAHLATLLERLAIAHDFDEMAIVAHSMGGLLSRGAILKYHEEARRRDVKLFVSISTPWAGLESAEGAKGSPIELPPSFQDMSPASDYLRWIFYEDEQEHSLPPSVEYHMLYGFKMSGSNSVSNDGTVTVASQLRPEVQDQATSQRGFDLGHVEILKAPEVRTRLNWLLERRFD